MPPWTTRCATPHRRRGPSGQHALADVFQRGVIRLSRVQFDRLRGHAGFAEAGGVAADALDLAVPHGRARQRDWPASNRANLMLDEPQLSTSTSSPRVG
jgi:hypothetical protein